MEADSPRPKDVVKKKSSDFMKSTHRKVVLFVLYHRRLSHQMPPVVATATRLVRQLGGPNNASPAATTSPVSN
uniref:Uncharacterized protein n=1 Tax=Romanomermis culicivorax TaxID=13658 RepID=A0A915JKA7_ROMCU